MSKQKLKEISKLPSINVAQIKAETGFKSSTCEVPKAIFFPPHPTGGLPWLDFKEKLVSFFLKMRKEETFSDTFPTENSTDFTSDS